MAVAQNWTWTHNDLGVFLLQNYAWNIATFTGRRKTAGRRGGNMEVTYRDGTIWVPKDFRENEIELAMWVLGCESDGTVPDDPSEKFWQNLAELQRAFVTDRVQGFLSYVHPVQNKTVIATCEIKEAIDFTTMAGATRAAFIVRFTIPKVWFRDVTYFGESVATSRAPASTWDVTIDSDVLIKDPLITINGPVTNPKLTNLSLSGGDNWVIYNGVVGAGEVLVIDPATWRATLDGVKVTGGIDWSGQPQFFWLKPGENEIQFDGDTSTEVQIQAKGAYW